MSEPLPLPDPALVVLVGASGSGKSTWAAARFRATEIVSSDALRGIVGSGPADMDASTDAFDLLETILAARIGRRLTTVVDTTGLDTTRRLAHLARARAAGLPAVAVVVDTDAAVCRRRNAERDRPVPAPVLAGQLRRVRDLGPDLAAEGWDLVHWVLGEGRAGAAPAALDSRAPIPAAPVAAPGAPGASGAPGAPGQSEEPAIRVVLQVSRFGWGDHPGPWLKDLAAAADELGFAGLALMDHLIQIPQVGRAWDPIPEPWVTLGYLAGLDTRLELGTLVSPVTFRAPGIIAKTVATLDAISGGRAFCGLGAGWWEREHLAYGLGPLPPAPERLDRLETCIDTLRALWSPGTKPHAGPLVTLPETTCYPRPVGRVPIIVGGAGRRTLRIAAERADGCNVPADDHLPDRVSAVRDRCARAGRDPGEVAITVLDVPVIGSDRDEVAARVERLRGRTPAAVFAARHHAGVAAEHARRYRDLADLGVRTVFCSLPDLTGAGDLERCQPLLAALAHR